MNFIIKNCYSRKKSALVEASFFLNTFSNEERHNSIFLYSVACTEPGTRDSHK